MRYDLTDHENLLWTTADGAVVEIADMSDSHLLNAIEWLRRSAGDRREGALASGYSVASYVQGEMAQYYIDRELDILGDKGDVEFLLEDEPRYVVMIREAARRGLARARLRELAEEALFDLDQEDRKAFESLGLCEPEPAASRDDVDGDIPF